LNISEKKNISKKALLKIKLIVKPLVEKDWVIVSGMAKGIDSYAHKLALSYTGKTIAVLGGGFNHIYPKQNFTLFNQIAEKGLVLSERSEEHTSELQSRFDLVCRLLLEKKKIIQ